MVFLIQKTQNKDALAIQLKLNELLASNERASNRMISVEDLTEEELKLLHKFYLNLALLAKQEGDVYKSHSVETAIQLHKEKKKIHEKEFVEEVVDPQLKEMAEAEKQIRKRKRRSGAEV